jgi:dTMP kinase
MIIAIEGIDASGKRTQTQLLRRIAARNGLSVATLSYPRYGQTFFAEAIAKYLNGGFGDLAAVDPHFAGLLYAGDRLESRHVIEELAGGNDLLIIDRYVASNLVYQAAKVASFARPSLMAWLATVEYEVYHLPHADLTFFIDTPVATAFQLLQTKTKRSYTSEVADLHERDRSFQATCRELYVEMVDQQYCGTWIRVPSTDEVGNLRSREDVALIVWEAVSRAIAETPSPTARAL